PPKSVLPDRGARPVRARAPAIGERKRARPRARSGRGIPVTDPPRLRPPPDRDASARTGRRPANDPSTHGARQGHGRTARAAGARTRRRVTPRRRMHPLRARGGLSRPRALDERRPGRGPPHLRTRGIRTGHERTTHELRKEPRRTELAPSALSLAQRFAEVLGRSAGMSEADPRL